MGDGRVQRAAVELVDHAGQRAKQAVGGGQLPVALSFCLSVAQLGLAATAANTTAMSVVGLACWSGGHRRQSLESLPW